MSRERFEKLFPLKPGVVQYEGSYINKSSRYAVNAAFQRGAWQAYQSRQPEIDELVEALEKLERYASLNAMDHLLTDGWEKTPHFSKMLDDSRALIAKHKGKP